MTQPAFPSIEYDVNGGHWEGRYDIFAQHAGLSKREWFVGQILSNPAICHSELMQHQAARTAVEVADLVLELLNTAPQIALGIGGAE